MSVVWYVLVLLVIAAAFIIMAAAMYLRHRADVREQDE